MTAPLGKIMAVALVGAMALVFVAIVAFSQIGQRPAGPLLKMDPVVRPPATAEATDARPLETDARPLENVVKLSKPGDKEAIAVADLFKSQPTPSIRATYFRSVLTSPDFCFKKWFLTIEDAKAVDGVTRVTVRAIPMVTSRFAAYTLMGGYLDETYDIEGGNLKLVKTDPVVDPNVVVQFGFDGM